MSKSVVSIDFDAPFDVQAAQARAQGVVLPEYYYGALQAEKRKYAQTVSSLAGLDQIQPIVDKLAEFQAEGKTLAEFKKWAKTQDWTLPNGRLETIYRNSVQTAYQAGHWRDFEENKDERPYLMYDAINDSRVRPSHLALDNTIKPVDDPFWDTHSPPLGHRCRCSLRSLSPREAMKHGGVTQNVPSEGGPDEGWGSKPTQWGQTLERLKEEKLAKAPEVIARAVDNAGMPEPTLRDLNFWGQRPGLSDLPPVPVVELTGEEFGAGLRHAEIMDAANKHMRLLQKGAGLPNSDTEWTLRINKLSRKKIGDNIEQSDAELKAVAGLEQLARVAIVAERHADDRHANPDVLAVLRLFAPMLLDGIPYRVRLTVKDYGDPRMLHALSAIEIENAPLGTLPAYSGANALQQGQPTTGRTVSIRDLLKTAILENGKPYDI